MHKQIIIAVTLLCTLLLAAGLTRSAPPAQAQTGTVELVGQIGGATQAVFVEGNIAYIGEGPRLTILDIANPANPTVLGKSAPLPDIVQDVYVIGSYAYVAASTSGLQIINISTPANPTLTSSYDTPGGAYDVAVSGSLAYVADNYGGLQIINISNPANPTLTGSYDTPGVAYGVAVSGSYAYVADDSSGLQIINISNPANPTLNGSYDTPGLAWGVAVSGSYAYVADALNGLQIINISNPANPTLSGSYDTPLALGVAVSGNYAYVTASSGFQVINISNPANPTLTGSYNTSFSTAYAYGVAVSGSYAYVADGWGSGLQIINISNPANPTLTGSYDTPGKANGVAVSGSYAYVADGWWGGGLQIINISNPANPTLTGSYDTPGRAAYEVAVSGSYAYVADDSSGLQIINISNPANPTLAGSYDTPGNANGVAVSGSYAYVADDSSGLQIINISNPANPTLTGSYDTPGNANGVAVSGSYAYVADDSSGLQIINISNPANPTLAGSYDTPGNANGVAVSGSYAYVADDSSGLQIINISNPANPTLSGSYNTPVYALGVAVSGSYAYVADNTSGLQIINISNPANPTLSGSYDTPSGASDVVVSGSYAYVADRGGGLVILQFNTSNTSPTPITLTADPGNTSLQLTWNSTNAPNFSHYKIYRKVEGASNFALIQDSWTETTFFDEDSTLSSGTNYCYQVEAIQVSGDSDTDAGGGGGRDSTPTPTPLSSRQSDDSVYVTSNEACATFGQLALWVPNVKAKVGEQGVIVPVNIRNANGLQIGATDIWLDFDPTIIESVAISRTGLTAEYAWEKAVVDTDTGKRVRIAAIQDATPPELYGDGSLFWLTFDVVGQAGSSTPLDVQDFITGVGGGGSTIYSPDDLNNAIPLTIEDGLLNVEAVAQYILGDVNGNEVVQAVDALFALRIASGEIQPTLEQRYAGDVNGNGVVQAADASMILYYAAYDSWPPVTSREQTGQQTTLRLQSVTGLAGQTVETTLQANNLINFAGGTFVIVYDAQMVSGIEQVKVDGLTTNFQNLTYSDDGTGRVLISLADDAEISGTGTLLTLSITLDETVTDGQTSNLLLADAQLNDLNGRDFVTSFENNQIVRQSGTVTVGSSGVYLPIVVK